MGAPSSTTVRESGCDRASEFPASADSFTVSEIVSTGAEVGTVFADDPDATDAVAYSIAVGNEDYEFVSSYALSVEAGDGRGGSDYVTVNIAGTGGP